MARKPKTDDAPLDLDDEFTISTEKVCFIIVKAREFDVKDTVTEPDPGSNAADDEQRPPCWKTTPTIRCNRSSPRSSTR